jgi:hypothetical protein
MKMRKGADVGPVGVCRSSDIGSCRTYIASGAKARLAQETSTATSKIAADCTAAKELRDEAERDQLTGELEAAKAKAERFRAQGQALAAAAPLADAEAEVLRLPAEPRAEVVHSEIGEMSDLGALRCLLHRLFEQVVYNEPEPGWV